MTDPAFVTKDYLIEDLKELGVKGTVSKYRNSFLPSRIIHELYQDEEFKALSTLFIASYPNSPGKLLKQIIDETSDEEVLARLAVHPRTDREMMMKLCESESIKVRQNLAANKQITPNVSDKIARDSNLAVKAVLAENPSLVSRIQVLLAKDPESFIKTTLALRKEVTPEAVDLLRFDEDFLVKSAIITLLNNNDKYLLSLADSDRLIDQFLLLQKELLSESVLESLTLSSHPEVRTEAIRKKSLNDEELVGLANDPEIEIRRIIAQQHNLPEFVQDIICKDCDEIKLTLAKNFPTPAYALKLAKECPEIQLALTENPEIDSKTLEYMCKNSRTAILEAIALRDDLTDSHLNSIINDRKSIDAIYALAINERYFDNISEEMTVKLSKNRSATVRAYAALSKNVNDEAVSKLLKDASPLVKEHLIKNPMVENHELEVLLSDKNLRIVSFAQEEIERRKIQEAEKPEVITGVKKFVNNLIDKVRGK